MNEENLCPLLNSKCTPDCAWYDHGIRAATGNPNYSTCSVAIIKNRLGYIEQHLQNLPIVFGNK